MNSMLPRKDWSAAPPRQALSPTQIVSAQRMNPPIQIHGTRGSTMTRNVALPPSCLNAMRFT